MRALLRLAWVSVAAGILLAGCSGPVGGGGRAEPPKVPLRVQYPYYKPTADGGQILSCPHGKPA